MFEEAWSEFGRQVAFLSVPSAKVGQLEDVPKPDGFGRLMYAQSSPISGAFCNVQVVGLLE
jgi:hypothetical protein